jgi:hypothetical protein
MTFFFTIWLIPPESKVNLHFRMASRYFIIASFAAFLVVYLTVLYKLMNRLQAYFPKFFLRERNKIVVANGTIIVSIISRITVNLWYLGHMD